MISLIFPRVTGKSKIFYVKITIGTGDNTDYFPKLREFGKFRIGNDDDESEMILFPGQFSFSFIANTKAEFDVIHNALKLNDDAEIVVRYNDASGNIRFKGKSNYQSIDSRRIVRTFSMIFYDDYKVLQEPWNIPAGPTFPDQYMTVEELLRLSCELDFDELIITTEFSFDYDDGGSISFPISELAFHKYNKFGSYRKNVPGTADVRSWYMSSLKSQTILTVLNNFASYAVIGLDRKLYISPRFYQGNSGVININAKDTTSGSTHSTFLKKYRGMRLMIMFVDSLFEIWHYGDVFLKDSIYPHEIDNEDQVETYWVQCQLSSNDEGDPGYATQVRRKDSGGTLFNVMINTTRYRQSDGTLSAYGGLGNHLGNILFSLISVSKSKVYAKIQGTEYNHSNFFTVDGLTTKYRPLMMEYDDILDVTDLVLIECPEIHAHTPLVGVL